MLCAVLYGELNISAGLPLIHLLASESGCQYQQIIKKSTFSIPAVNAKILEDIADFQKTNVLNKLLLVFCLGV